MDRQSKEAVTYTNEISNTHKFNVSTVNDNKHISYSMTPIKS